LNEALTAGNENHVGSKVAEFLTFFPIGHNAQKMSTIRLHALCAALKIEVPRLTRIESEEDLQPFCAAIEENQAPVWTEHEKDKKTGEVRTKLLFTEPRAKVVPLDFMETEAAEELGYGKKKKAGRR